MSSRVDDVADMSLTQCVDDPLLPLVTCGVRVRMRILHAGTRHVPLRVA